VSLVSRYLEPALIERLNHLQLSARSVVEGATIGMHKSPLKGASVEFRQHRFYVPGDEPRRLDWRVLARSDRPYIREYDEETNLRCVLLLDCSGSMSYAGGNGSQGTKFDLAAKLVASLAYLMLGQTESVGLAMAAPTLETWLAPHGGTGQLSRVIESLERTAPRGVSDVPRTMHQVADRLGRRSLIIVVSDLFAPAADLRRGMARLRHDRHELILLRVLDADELDFPFRRWSRFRGLEGETPMLCEPALVRQRYLGNFNAHARELQDACRTLGGESHSFLTNQPLADSLTSFLQRRAGK
jgi:uncharacterized protein (DUF58 family)